MYDDLLTALAASAVKLELTYLGHEDEVADLIDQCEWAIKKRNGSIGQWERHELAQARTAWRAGWLRLALVAAEKALFVSEVPGDAAERNMPGGWHAGTPKLDESQPRT